MVNRIINSITAMRAQVENRISDGIVSRADVDKTHATMDMDHTEWTMFQDVKSLAHASGIITHDEAQTVFACLGSSPADFNSEDVATKAALTKLFQELLRWKMAKQGKHRAM